MHISLELGNLEILLRPATPLREMRCSALVKPLADGRDLYVGHTTDLLFIYVDSYQKYKFSFRSVKDRRELTYEYKNLDFFYLIITFRLQVLYE